MFEKFFDYLGNIRLFAAPFLAMAVVGFIGFIYYENPFDWIVLMLAVIMGVFLGFLLVKRVSSKGSTHDYLSKIDATPDLDEDD